MSNAIVTAAEYSEGSLYLTVKRGSKTTQEIINVSLEPVGPDIEVDMFTIGLQEIETWTLRDCTPEEAEQYCAENADDLAARPSITAWLNGAHK